MSYTISGVLPSVSDSFTTLTHFSGKPNTLLSVISDELLEFREQFLFWGGTEICYNNVFLFPDHSELYAQIPAQVAHRQS